MNNKTILKTTGQEVFPLHYTGLEAKGAAKPWPNTHERVLIPNPHGKNHIQIVKKDKLRRLKE